MASSLGKRKEREEEGEFHGSTLFVSNLPYTATSTDLQTLFSDFAPVRSAFVVLEPGSGVSKGVGYVSFAIKEDAQMASDKIAEEGLVLDGRQLRAQWADSKIRDKSQVKVKHPTQSPVKTEAKSPAPRPQPLASKDPLAIRTVVISGLPPSVDSKALWKKIRKLQGGEKVEWPVKISSGEEDSEIAHALFATPAAASEAVNKLHAHVFKGSLLSATLKKRLDGLAKAPSKAMKAAAPKPDAKGAAPSRASRLIVRNLPFNTTEQDLRAVFLPFGPIYSVDIPLKDSEGEGKPRAKGFAFVWMLSRKDAERAMEGANGMKVYAGMAVRLVTDKQKKKKQRREEEKAEKAAKGQGELEEEDEGPETRGKERVIAVDWALSKDKWQAEKAKLEQEGADVQMEDESDGGSESEESDSDDEQIGVHEDGGSDEGSGSDSDEDDLTGAEESEGDEDREKPALPPPESGTTLFVRNVPFEATEDELRTLFRSFGPLRYARITMDHEIGRSRGTGFVCFWNKADADKAVEQSEILRAEMLGDNDKVAAPKKNPFKLPSLLTPDPSSSIAQNLVLHGRTLDVNRAVTRDEASKLKEAGERQREKADKRNLYLLREGIILPNAPAAESVGPAEVERRAQSFNARRALLRSNPSLYVSKTRLSIRQLPLFATERMLKRLAVHAVRAFEKEVKGGARDPLTPDELAESVEPANEDETIKNDGSVKSKTLKGHGKEKKAGRDTGVQQAKIVRQADRVDPVTGKGRSRGYGFLEMTKHADALRVLRWANNNPEVGRLFEEWWKAELEDMAKNEKKKPQKDEARLKRLKDELEKGAPVKSRGTLIVEFSIENVQVVQRRDTRQREKQPEPGISTRRQRVTSSPAVKTEKTEERPSKKRRVPDPSQPQVKKSESNEVPKAGQQIGSLIGRKRKEKKSKRG
ncbi:RNA-binding domain-containing protein [Rhodofomes roseus]|uniref:RNA-binding domain-containing protein n=1 Tax=Rhodofomes roseus TaxID=34475 RepID=A0ABQ8JXG2_9APHY|nr:RNA-binding domain-containing protein [Rhodofomes roseus]KAH9828792.1 RNA-binding domain-containing protein [Rhodofomes roseus]